LAGENIHARATARPSAQKRRAEAVFGVNAATEGGRTTAYCDREIHAGGLAGNFTVAAARLSQAGGLMTPIRTIDRPAELIPLLWRRACH